MRKEIAGLPVWLVLLFPVSWVLGALALAASTIR